MRLISTKSPLELELACELWSPARGMELPDDTMVVIFGHMDDPKTLLLAVPQVGASILECMGTLDR